eukprot:m.68710 g.68710  ORF g.68710 m.68710 type:complete len:458 (-) comp8254_c0_seq1:3852-5225(-)
MVAIPLLFVVVTTVAVAVAMSAVATRSFPSFSIPSSSSCSPQDPQTARCSEHGLFLFDVNECECFQCYSGSSCEKLDNNCTLDVSVADGYIFEDYFVKNWDSPSLVVTVPAWYRMTYQRPMVMPTYLNSLITKTIFDLHKAVGNANVGRGLQLVLPNGGSEGAHHKVLQQPKLQQPKIQSPDTPSLMIGTGSTMVLRALIATMAQMQGKQMNVVARAPCYPMFKYWAEENPVWSVWSNRTDLDPSTVIEIVTYPNNPDGEKHAPLYPDAKYIIYDMVYYWPHLSVVDEMLDEDVMVFSSSKLTGHGASRFGWAIVKDANLAAATTGFAQIEEISNSVDSIHRQLGILNYIHSNESTFFEYSKSVLEERWKELQGFFEKQSKPQRFSLESVPNTWFAWVNCLSLAKGESCQQVFQDAGIVGEFGNGEMGIEHHIRLSINLHATAWPILTQKLSILFNV